MSARSSGRASARAIVPARLVGRLVRSKLTGKPELLKTIVPDRPGYDRRYLLDSSKLRR